MKIIDLLNKIANGEEVPEKIKYRGLMYYQDGRGYFHDETECTTERAFLEGVRTDMVLNEEVEILDEEDEFIDIEEIKLERDDILGYYNGASHRMTTNVKDREVYIKIINNLIKNQKKIIQALKKEGK